MERIEVQHHAFRGQGETVAVVEVDASWSLNQKLEYAFRWTNSIAGCWSKGKIIEDREGNKFENSDYNPNVTIVYPLHIDKDGVEWGHRSTSVDDRMVIGDKTYVVADLGFENLEGERVQ